MMRRILFFFMLLLCVSGSKARTIYVLSVGISHYQNLRDLKKTNGCM